MPRRVLIFSSFSCAVWHIQCFRTCWAYSWLSSLFFTTIKKHVFWAHMVCWTMKISHRLCLISRFDLNLLKIRRNRNSFHSCQRATNNLVLRPKDLCVYSYLFLSKVQILPWIPCLLHISFTDNLCKRGSNWCLNQQNRDLLR